jgi:hypothetical protein
MLLAQAGQQAKQTHVQCRPGRAFPKARRLLWASARPAKAAKAAPWLALGPNQALCFVSTSGC